MAGGHRSFGGHRPAQACTGRSRTLAAQGRRAARARGPARGPGSGSGRCGFESGASTASAGLPIILEERPRPGGSPPAEGARTFGSAPPRALPHTPVCPWRESLALPSDNQRSPGVRRISRSDGPRLHPPTPPASRWRSRAPARSPHSQSTFARPDGAPRVPRGSSPGRDVAHWAAPSPVAPHGFPIEPHRSFPRSSAWRWHPSAGLQRPSAANPTRVARAPRATPRWWLPFSSAPVAQREDPVNSTAGARRTATAAADE